MKQTLATLAIAFVLAASAATGNAHDASDFERDKAKCMLYCAGSAVTKEDEEERINY